MKAIDAEAGIAFQIGHLLRRAYVLARRNSAEALAEVADVTPMQAAAITSLAAGPVTQAELGRRIETEPANVHGLVRRMAEAGLVTVRPDPCNRRLSLVELAPLGRSIAAKLPAARDRSTLRTLAPLSPQERGQLTDFLRRITDAPPSED